MADTFTTYYNLTKPQVGGDPDTWGNLLNANFDTIDSQLHTASTYALPLSGGTLTGALAGTSASFSGGLSANSVIAGSPNNSTQGVQVLWNSISPGTGRNEYVNNYGSGVGGHYFYSRSSVAGGAVLDAVIDTSGNISAVGNVTAQAGAVIGSSTVLTLQPLGSGALFLRPGGPGSATGQLSMSTTLASFSASLEATGGIHALGTTAFNGQGSYLGWNRSGGQGEMDFICHHGGGAGGWYFYDTDGSTYTLRSSLSNGGVWSAADFQATSDATVKTCVRKLRRGLDELKRMLPREYIKDGREEIGFIAQEAQQVIPEAVTEGDDGLLRLSYGQVTALLAAAILDLDRRMTLEGF